MGHVASGDNYRQEIRSQQDEAGDSWGSMIPTTPGYTQGSIMDEAGSTHTHENAATVTESPRSKQHGAEASNTIVSEDHESGPEYAHTDTTTDDSEDPYASLDPDTLLLIPITNPSAFPIQRLQEVQSQRQPSTHMTNMWCHKTPAGPITQVTADIQDGSINHLFIRDQRWISALGLAAPDFDTIHLDATKLRLDETFTIKIFTGQRTQRLDEWIMGELVGARHAYLCWLDERRSADPKAAPYAAEAKAIARKTGRRWTDVMSEIESVWKLEKGRDGTKYRGNRAEYLGEDPTYSEGAEERRVVRSMFG